MSQTFTEESIELIKKRLAEKTAKQKGKVSVYDKLNKYPKKEFNIGNQWFVKTDDKIIVLNTESDGNKDIEYTFLSVSAQEKMAKDKLARLSLIEGFSSYIDSQDIYKVEKTFWDNIQNIPEEQQVEVKKILAEPLSIEEAYDSPTDSKIKVKLEELKNFAENPTNSQKLDTLRATIFDFQKEIKYLKEQRVKLFYKSNGKTRIWVSKAPEARDHEYLDLFILDIQIEFSDDQIPKRCPGSLTEYYQDFFELMDRVNLLLNSDNEDVIFYNPVKNKYTYLSGFEPKDSAVNNRIYRRI